MDSSGQLFRYLLFLCALLVNFCGFICSERTEVGINRWQYQSNNHAHAQNLAQRPFVIFGCVHVTAPYLFEFEFEIQYFC